MTKNRLWDLNNETQFFKRAINELFGVEIVKQVIRSMNPPSFIAVLTPGGYQHDRRVYETEKAFNEALDKLFERQTERARVIVLD